MSPLVLLILIILTFSKNKDSYVFENKGTLIQEQKAVQTILPIIAFFFLFCCPATYNRENRSSNPLAALTMLILIILVFGNDGKLRKGVSGKSPAKPYKNPPVAKTFAQKQNQAIYQGKDSLQHGLNALTILVLILLQYGQGSYYGQDKKTNVNRPVTDDAFSTNNENEAYLDDMAPMDPSKENLLLIYLSILASLNLNESDEPAEDVSVRIIDKKTVVDNFVSPVNPQEDVTPISPQPASEPDDASTRILTVPASDAVTYPTAQNDEEDTKSDTEFMDAFIEQDEPPKVEEVVQEEAPVKEQEVEEVIQEIKDVINTTSETEQNPPEESMQPELESESNKESVTTPFVPTNPEMISNASEMDAPLASIIQKDYEGSFVTTLLSNLVAAGGEVIFHFNHIISLKLGDKIYFINEKDLLGFY